jgi:peptide-methionine (S)-S-oxide reductase
MFRFISTARHTLAAAFGIAVLAGNALAAAPLPAPTADTPLAAAKRVETAVLAGGCFWGVEAVFEHVKGVTQVVSGYAGGTADTAKYNVVSSGTTKHAESVRVSYDPSKITYGQILRIFFSVAHNPTELNRQGPDTGPQYRSAIFYANEEQKKVAQAYIAQLNAAKAFPKAIVTEVAPLKAFYDAEAYHQDFAARNPMHPYIVMHDAPKVAALQRQFPEVYTKEQLARN